jgi:CRP/FNR family transcriptional regulator
MTAHLAHILGGLALFDGVDPAHLTRIAPIFTARTFERGEQMLGANDTQARTAIMVAGTARASRVTADGRSIAVALIDTGDLYGRLPFDEHPTGERIDALERCTVLRSSTADFEALLVAEPTVAIAVLGGISRRLRASGRRLEGLAFHQVPARLARVLLDLSDRYGKVTATGVRVDVRITHGQLAELVATTRETLTKVAGWLRVENIASLERRQIWIADYAALQEVAEGLRVMPGRAQRAVDLAAGDDEQVAGDGAQVGHEGPGAALDA